MLQRLKSKYILEIIFCYIKNRKKLNIIKYIKNILFRLNLKEKDFKVYLTLKEFNEKYHSNIKDIDIKELNLSDLNLRNEGLELLSEIEFKELIILDLSKNKISDINILQKFNLEKLEKLNLNFNQISDINILEKLKLEELKE